MTSTQRPDEQLELVRRVALQLPGLPWLTVLDAVDDCQRITEDAPFMAHIVEAATVARLRSGRGLIAA